MIFPVDEVAEARDLDVELEVGVPLEGGSVQKVEASVECLVERDSNQCGPRSREPDRR
jgi:hypothetical protein